LIQSNFWQILATTANHETTLSYVKGSSQVSPKVKLAFPILLGY
jgi:hypothetical protein